ncbi:hypothetical protein LKL35_23845 [Streptomyces sp. ET3-23]|uniref:PQQ-binding-like beta-propeller repeat protein n=1 Tax=Streptomyces sp. ET3-23 TaxID=2885643 RepID=UPI001D121EBD|nr:PQQ-binding-like beta-propeller repeat protein [Streptomyces sp. ET3-23]MCC2278432.1 hypothetical protein [Streptomyces sp. ET3-23]
MSQPPQPGAPQTPPPPAQGGGQAYMPTQAFGAVEPPAPPAGAPQTPPQTPPPPPPPAAPGGFGPPEQPAAAPGYGYPQTPPAQGGFGAPEQPAAAPAAPGYGYPQTPPPPAPGGYGYPQTPPPAAPAGYGYPQTPPPAAPGGYGYPQQYPAGPAGPFPPPPGSPKKKPPMAAIIGGAVALALLAGGGIWYATSGSSDNGGTKTDSSQAGGPQGGGGSKGAPATVNGKMLFSVDSPQVDDLVNVKGTWVTDQVFAKSDVYKVVGYGLSGGKKYEIPLDGEICWASQQVTPDGKTAVLVKESKPTPDKKYGGPCDQVVALDLNNGKKLWQKAAKAGDQPVSFGEVTVGGGTVAAGGTSGGAAWSLSDGKELWTPKAGDDCRDDGYGGGTKLVAVRRCGDYARPQMQVQTLDPATGGIKSTYKVPAGLNYVHVVSTDPLVVAVDAGDHTGSAASDFLAIDDSAKEGTLRSKVSTQNGKFTPKCESTNVEGCKKVVVSKDTLYLPTQEHQSGNSQEVGRVTDIVGFGLSDGQSRGKVSGAPGSSITPLSLDRDGYLVAYQDPTYKAGGMVIRIDPKTFKTDVLMKNPVDTVEAERKLSPNYQDVVWSQGRLYMGNGFANKPGPAGLGKDYLALVFGGS